MELILKEESYQIVGCCFEVYKEMGCGFLESVYEECPAIEFQLQNIPFRQQSELPLTYKSRRLVKVFQPDLICFEQVVVEIKAVSSLTDVHRAQVHNYVKATGLRLGLLVNFNCHPQLECERIVR
jgi:GxxExxY protein